MFPVKIFNAKGELKKIISAEEALKNMWENFPPKSKRPTSTKKCSQCEKEFKTWDPRVKFCGPKCKNLKEIAQRKYAPSKIKRKNKRAEERKKIKICKLCKRFFSSATKTREFCKPACNKTYHQRIAEEKR